MARSLRILLVEDEKGDVIITKRALANMGALGDVPVASNGEEALDFLNQSPSPTDLILLDLNMIRMNGFEFLREVRQDPRFEKIPVVILTLSARPSDMETAYALGANAYVIKPPEVREFMATVVRVVRYWKKLKLN
jgi:two-component system, chemotaxis family, response regulator Rcp1